MNDPMKYLCKEVENIRSGTQTESQHSKVIVLRALFKTQEIPVIGTDWDVAKGIFEI